jgi:hypothetical protein
MSLADRRFPTFSTAKCTKHEARNTFQIFFRALQDDRLSLYTTYTVRELRAPIVSSLSSISYVSINHLCVYSKTVPLVLFKSYIVHFHSNGERNDDGYTENSYSRALNYILLDKLKYFTVKCRRNIKERKTMKTKKKKLTFFPLLRAHRDDYRRKERDL